MKDDQRRCSVEKCSDRYYAKGYCKRHYRQDNAYGEITVRRKSDPNEIEIFKDHAEIVLYDSRCRETGRAIIDISDIEAVKVYKWHIGHYEKKRLSYAHGTLKNDRRTYRLHRVLLGLVNADAQVDHINHNGLDNRRSNLRIATGQENCRNKRKADNCFSNFKGVCRNRSLWIANIKIDGRLKNLGRFKSEIAAAKAYDAAASKFFGSFACLNFDRHNEVENTYPWED